MNENEYASVKRNFGGERWCFYDDTRTCMPRNEWMKLSNLFTCFLFVWIELVNLSKDQMINILEYYWDWVFDIHTQMYQFQYTLNKSDLKIYTLFGTPQNHCLSAFIRYHNYFAIFWSLNFLWKNCPPSGTVNWSSIGMRVF